MGNSCNGDEQKINKEEVDCSENNNKRENQVESAQDLNNRMTDKNYKPTSSKI